MYSEIDVRASGQVIGVYTGFSQAGRSTTYLDPINAEHTVPQSWFAKKEPMRSDLHHLFPTHRRANSTRRDHPYAEIIDANTDKWLCSLGSKYRSSISSPEQENHTCAEYDNSSFEPPEHHKGDVARAIAYFYTMYPESAGEIDRIVKGQRALLLQWHRQDPVDEWEATRNQRVFRYQGNLNPYIADESLLCRAWLPEQCNWLISAEQKKQRL